MHAIFLDENKQAENTNWKNFFSIKPQMWTTHWIGFFLNKKVQIWMVL